MNIPGINFGAVVFPGRAGELQNQGASASLYRELGSNYATYHAYLAQQVTARVANGRPKRDQFATLEQYLSAWGYLIDLVRSEQSLRLCKAMVLGTPAPAVLAAAGAPSMEDYPLVTRNDELGAWD